MQDKISRLTEVFPHFKGMIESLLQSDEEFREVCSDFTLCECTLIDLRNDKVSNPEKMEEYETLHQQLEQDIFRMLMRFAIKNGNDLYHCI